MTEPQNPEDATGDDFMVVPGATVRAGYDEQGALTSLVVEYLECPETADLCQILAQLTGQSVTLPTRLPGDALARAQSDESLVRRFNEVLGVVPTGTAECAALANIINSEDRIAEHDNHLCRVDAGHGGMHICACGTRF